MAITTLSACSFNTPNWLVIEYPIENDNTVMKFPGVQADSLEECTRQVNEIKDSRVKSIVSDFEEYKGKFQCGSNCRFSKELGSPLCDELVDL